VTAACAPRGWVTGVPWPRSASTRLGTARGIDEADGIDATTATLGPRYPLGLFVAQDGRNDGGDRNFKLVRLP
jgi:myo-inositol-hexaphosphate 3-phosphohydrolase